MRTAILAAADSWYLRDLRRAAAKSIEITVASFAQLQARIDSQHDVSVTAGTEELSRCDAIIVRSMPPGSLEQVIFRMDALAQAEKAGCLVVNPPRALEIAIDKYLALARVVDEGLRVPDTITCQSWDAAMAGFESLGGDVVVKPLFGSEGRGITRVSDPALALRAFKMLENLGAVIYLQPFIDHGGFDTRALVIGEQVLAMRRSNPHDWRTNISHGATAEPVVLDERQRDVARRAARAVGAPMAGVDLLQDRSGELFVLEVNAVPGWKALSRAVGVDVARLVWDWIEKEVRLRA